MSQSCAGGGATTSNVLPGLGFVHLSTAAAKLIGSKARGEPKGEPSGSWSECCDRCAANAACTVWLRRGDGKCFLGNCTASAQHPCLERMRAGQQQPSAAPTAGASAAGGRTLVCTRPAPTAAGSRSRRKLQSAQAGDAAASGGLALLLLGHRARLMLSTIPPNVIRPVVASGTRVELFALLENSTMARAFRGRRPMGHPDLAPLGDDQLAARIARDVQAAGGRVASIRIVPRPTASLPAAHPSRLSRYTEHVKLTVATRFLKERLGLQMVLDHEAANKIRFTWVLWTREDSHWFAPLQLPSFERGKVHGKACGGFGGWNDKVWLMDRDWAEQMLSMYDAFHEPHPSKCVDLSKGWPTTDARSRADDLDFLSAPSVEQFRERVGKLRRVPFVKHPPDDLPTMDSYYRQDANGAGWRLCFPRIYAHGCVPRANQSAVDEKYTCS